MVSSAEDVSRIRRVTYIGMAINVMLSALKFVFGILGSSQAVIADAVHSLSDMSTDFAIIFGVKLWSAPADEDHPYGHKRIESIVTAAIGIFLVSVALGIGYNALITIRDHPTGRTTWIAFYGAFISIIAKEALYRYTILVGQQVRSSAVIANAWHHRTDALSSIPVAIAVAMATLNPVWDFLDHVGALFVSLFILKVAWGITKPALAELEDRGASKKERDLIEAQALTIAGVKSVHAIRTRLHGPGLFVDLHILVDGAMSVRAGHEISGRVKHKLIAEGPHIMDVIVHIEPFEEGP
ncbi:cation diffusion facilitator family transporter [candidate division CSSED10-310 bacterium]|uniref:Cation diffusion facilitator family transporter n=1 Tax=candidate division CSSED10-310 bacterium TaxID=2855610 RepID=A0ABV6YVX4_UNCC1